MKKSDFAELVAKIELHREEIASGLVNRREVLKMTHAEIAELEELQGLVDVALQSRTTAALKKAEAAYQKSDYFQSLDPVF